MTFKFNQRARQYFLLSFWGLWITFSGNAQQTDWSWARQAGGEGVEHLQAITQDGQGGIWITGTFERTCIFGSDTLISRKGKDVYLAHLNATGNWTQAFALSSPKMVYCYDLGSDQSGNLYLSGAFQDSLLVEDQWYISQDGIDSYLISFDPSGTLRWFQQAGGKGIDGTFALAFSQDYLFTLNLFEECPADSLFVTDQRRRANELEIRKHALDGTLEATFGFDGVGRVFPRLITTDPEGHLYLGGKYQGDLSYRGKQFDPEQSLFLLCLQPDGNLKWQRNFAYHSLRAGLNDMIYHPSGQLFLTGSFEDLGTFAAEPIASLGETDIFLSCLDAETGQLKWLERSGGRNYDKGMSLSKSDSAIYLTGWFESVGLFGTDSLVRSSGGNNLFISKYDLQGHFQWVEVPVARGRSYGSSLYRDDENYLYFGGWFEGLINFPSDLLLNDKKPDLFIGRFKD